LRQFHGIGLDGRAPFIAHLFQSDLWFTHYFSFSIFDTQIGKTTHKQDGCFDPSFQAARKQVSQQGQEDEGCCCEEEEEEVAVYWC
jgi:hypothetical protein